MIIIHVPAVPIAQPRPRAVSIRGKAMMYADHKHPVESFKATVRLAAAAVWQEENGAGPLDGPLSVALVFVLPRPKTKVWKTRPMIRECHIKKPDFDNLAKAATDALTGLCWVDDSQLCDVTIKKWIAAGDEQPHVTIRIQKVKQ